MDYGQLLNKTSVLQFSSYNFDIALLGRTGESLSAENSQEYSFQNVGER